MTEILIGPEVESPTDFESWVLDGLELNDGFDFTLEALTFLPARKRSQWADNPDSDGSEPVGETHYTNAEWIGRIRIEPQSSMDQALAMRGQLTDALQNCFEKEFVCTPADASNSTTWTALEGEYEDVPYTLQGDDAGYFGLAPVMIVKITLRSFGYGEPGSVSEVTYAAPIGHLVCEDIPGDVPAEATLIAKDNATQPRKHIEWGLEHKHFDPSSPFDLLLDEGDLSVSDTQGAVVADSDANGGNAIELKPLFSGWQDLGKKDDMPHRGTFRVKARPKNTADEETVSLRLLWRVGNTPYTDNAAAVVPAFGTAAYAEVDLGTISVPAGDANLDIFVQAKADTATASGEGVRLDYLELIPTERYGTGAGDSVTLGGAALSALDAFTHDLTSVLSGTTPDLGASWSGSGDTDDFILGSGYISRTLSAPDADLNTGRYSVFGSSLTNTRVEGGVWINNTSNTVGKEIRGGLLARYSDSNNWVGVFIRVKKKSGGRLRRVVVYKRVSGTVTKLAEVEAVDTPLLTQGGLVSGLLAMSVSAGGLIEVFAGSIIAGDTAASERIISVSDGSLPSSGKPGVYHAQDFSKSQRLVVIRRIAAYAGLGTTTETYAIPSSGRVEIGPQESTTYTALSAGDPAPFVTRGSHFTLPVGDSRVTVKARRNDVGSGGVDANLTDSTKLSATYRPRYLLPR